MTTYRSSWLAPAPVDDYFSNAPTMADHDFTGLDEPYHPQEDTGTPTVGIYANDGLWDEEDSELSISTARFSSAAASSIQTKGGSMKLRSRSGTASPFAQEEDKPGMWVWTRRGRDSPVTGTNSPEVPKGLTKKASRAMLRGKGRRGELMVNVDQDENNVSPPPVPPTPASHLQTPVTASPAFFSPPSHSSQHDENEPGTPKSKGSWKRGMQRMFRSKSSAALREISNAPNVNAPPVPSLPSHHNFPHPKHSLGKPFSASTPPPNAIHPRRHPGTTGEVLPARPGPESFGLYPAFPSDPFESRLDAGSKGIQQGELPRPKLPRHSPSLKSLKDFMSPIKPKLAKSKSTINVKEPTSAPALQTVFPPLPPPQRRMASMSSMRQEIRDSLTAGTTAPVESPPLLPPNPPYFPFVSNIPPSPSRSTPSLSILTSFPLPASPASSAAPMSPAPDAPLPPVPPPTSQPLAAEMPRSASAKLLPRSRSTSMSLRSPPTSSSFFDLYEQLGIWPTPEKDEEEEKSVKAAAHASKRNSSPTKLGRSADDASSSQTSSSSIPLKRRSSPTKLGRSPPTEPLSSSTSLAFSSSSWEAAISAFPVIGTELPRDPSRCSMDMLTHAGDITADSMMGMMSNVAVADSSSSASHASITTVDPIFTNTAAAASSSFSTRTHTIGSSSTAGPSRTQDRVSQPLQPVQRGRRRHSGGGSNSSSRSSSRERKPSLRKEGPWDRQWSSDDSSEEDDVPLSKLHPSAVVAQQEKKDRAMQRRADRVKAKASQIKLVGRNPGGGTGWNGEGGVPAQTLSMMLERLLLPRPSPVSATPSDYPWATANRSSPRAREATLPVQVARPSPHFAPHQRSSTEPTRGLPQREEGRPMVANIVTSPEMMKHDDRLPSPMLAPARTTSSRQDHHVPPSAVRPGEISRNSSSTSTHAQATISRLPPPIPVDFAQPGPSSLSRSNTAASKRSISRTRSRSNSTARHGLPSDENMIRANAAAEPMPALQRAMHVKAFIGTLEGKKVTLEILPETTARDILSEAARNGELEPLAKGMSWVVAEIFAELGCERYVREYEQLQTVVRGWDATAKYNCLIIKQTISGTPTWQKAIPQTAPFLGSWVQYESKKGKWSKRWLETRGGQVFLARNEKGKDEVQINTLFFDVYHMTRSYPSPKPFVFVMKRMDPEASFQNPDDYLHTFCAEDGVGYKLMAAIYDAKSFALQPHLLARQGHLQPVRKPTLGINGPLVNLVETKKAQESRTGFTGKGLLRI